MADDNAPAFQKKKGKQQKKKLTMSLNQFMSEAPVVAEPTIALPSAPRASVGVEIDLSTLPQRPPFKAHVGNLHFETEEHNIRDFFEDQKIKVVSVNIARDQGLDRIKGYGYAEFETVDDLRRALELVNPTLLGRTIRIGLADQERSGGRRGNDRGDRPEREENSRADDSNDWRRDKVPPAARETSDSDRGFDRGGRGSSDRGFNNRGGDRGFDRGGRGSGDRGFDRGGDRGFDRGGDRGFDRGGRGSGDRGSDRSERGGWRGGRGGDDRQDRSARGDEVDNWRSGGGAPSDRRGGHNSYNRGNDRRSERRDSSPENWRRGDSGSSSSRPVRQEKTEERKSEEKTEAPKERKPASNPFGAARPVDTAAKLAAVEEKLNKNKSDSQKNEPRFEEKTKKNADVEVSNKFAGLDIEDDE